MAPRNSAETAGSTSRKLSSRSAAIRARMASKLRPSGNVTRRKEKKNTSQGAKKRRPADSVCCHDARVLPVARQRNIERDDLENYERRKENDVGCGQRKQDPGDNPLHRRRVTFIALSEMGLPVLPGLAPIRPGT